MSDERKAQIYEEMLTWFWEHYSGQDLAKALSHCGMSDFEVAEEMAQGDYTYEEALELVRAPWE